MRSISELLYERPIHGDQTAWLTLDYLNLYRLFVALLYTGLFFTPVVSGVYASATVYAGKTLALVALVLSPALLLIGRRYKRRIGTQAALGLIFDLFSALLMFRLMGGISSGMGALLAGPMGAAGAIFPLRSALVYAATATIALLWQIVTDIQTGAQPIGSAVPHGLLGAAYFTTAVLGHYLAARARESQAIVRRRSEDLANMAALNEMIIERMRTGILIVDPKQNTQIMNESAWRQMGMPRQRHGKLADLAPQLLVEFDSWRADRHHRNQLVRLAAGQPKVMPRFARLGSGEPKETDTLVFLEDSAMVAHRAQELTLSSLGRLSASIAHEIRNPLAAISHSAQLLDESDHLHVEDRRLTEIIGRHCRRMNDIIENVLQLARQEPARPEPLDLGAWLAHFATEFTRSHDLGRSTLDVRTEDHDVRVRVDPSQLQQVLWNLCQNALKYGRQPGQAAHIVVRSRLDSDRGGPVLEVEDQGPGIPLADRERVFQPFFTTSAEGTGLGLYLCEQLCSANQASLTYQPSSTGGSLFRIHLIQAANPVDAPSTSSGIESGG